MSEHTAEDLTLFRYYLMEASSVGSDAGCQSSGCDFEPQLGQHSFRRLTNVSVISVILLPPMGYQTMLKSSQLLGKTVVCSTRMF